MKIPLWQVRDIERLCKDLDDAESYLKKGDSNGERENTKESVSGNNEV